MRAFAALAIALTASTATPAAAQDIAGAKAFVLGLYAAYRGKGPDYLGPKAAQVYSPRLLKLIRRDTALAHGEVGALDGDPICNCQDFEIKAVQADVNPAGPDRAQAVVRFRNFGDAETVRLDLIAVGGQWRIDNIHEKGTPDLAAYLQKHAGGR